MSLRPYTLLFQSSNGIICPSLFQATGCDGLTDKRADLGVVALQGYGLGKPDGSHLVAV